MKNLRALLLTIPLFLFSLIAPAQKTSITEIPTDAQTTTIQIKKGDQATTEHETTEILDGSAEIVGEPNVMQKAARASWTKACDDWKKEVKDLNKTNQVLILNCNSPKCVLEGGSTVCKSDATYKIGVKLKK